ncbi:MAG: LysR substrate-binding domain-containing protein [Achromobacter sp.]|jgi:DNA-binding transcriptional LysR family regulator
MFSLQICRYFVWVAETGSFRAAALRAHRSQPAISLAIKDMEARLGQPLFERGSPIVLTAFGRECLEVIKRLVEHAHSVDELLSSMARRNTSFLRVASIMSFATHWMPQLIEQFRAQHPQVALQIQDDNSEGVERLVLDGQIDLGICSEVSHDPRLKFTPLLKDTFGLVCHRGHPLAERKSLTWQQIATLPNMIGTVAHRQLDGYPQAAFLRHPDFFVSNMLSMIAMLARGLGVTVLAQLGVPPDRDDLVFVPLKKPGIDRRLGIMQLADATPTVASRAMENLLLTVVAQDG